MPSRTQDLVVLGTPERLAFFGLIDVVVVLWYNFDVESPKDASRFPGRVRLAWFLRLEPCRRECATCGVGHALPLCWRELRGRCSGRVLSRKEGDHRLDRREPSAAD